MLIEGDTGIYHESNQSEFERLITQIRKQAIQAICTHVPPLFTIGENNARIFYNDGIRPGIDCADIRYSVEYFGQSQLIGPKLTAAFPDQTQLNLSISGYPYDKRSPEAFYIDITGDPEYDLCISPSGVTVKSVERTPPPSIQLYGEDYIQSIRQARLDKGWQPIEERPPTQNELTGFLQLLDRLLKPDATITVMPTTTFSHFPNPTIHIPEARRVYPSP